MPAGHLSVSQWVFSFIQLPCDMKQCCDPCSTSACKSELGYKNDDDFINSRPSSDAFHALGYLLYMVSRALPCQSQKFEKCLKRDWKSITVAKDFLQTLQPESYQLSHLVTCYSNFPSSISLRFIIFPFLYSMEFHFTVYSYEKIQDFYIDIYE